MRFFIPVVTKKGGATGYHVNKALFGHRCVNRALPDICKPKKTFYRKK